jgi:hypothetical protein
VSNILRDVRYAIPQLTRTPGFVLVAILTLTLGIGASSAMQKEDVPTYAARLVAELPVVPEWTDKGDPGAWPERWVNEGLIYAKDAHRDIRIDVYLGPDAEKRIPHRWRITQPRGYDDPSRARIRIQLAKGGYRLAALLRAIWPG